MKLFTMLVAGLLTLSGCASPTPPEKLFYAVAPATVLTAPPADMAQMVFLMPKDLFIDAQVAAVYDISGPGRTLLTMLPSKSKSVHLVTPGRHRFMSNFGAHSYVLDANVVAGKRYYVLMRFIYGMGFQLRPIRTTSASDFSTTNPDFATWVSSTRFVQVTPLANEMDIKHKAGADTAQAEAVAVFSKKNAAQQAELTLNAEDAVAN